MSALARLGQFIQQNTLAPCRIATTTNITLSGIQTIGNVALNANERVLVRAQTDPSENGIYITNTGAWTRAPDWDASADVSTGTLVAVFESAVEGLYQASFAGDLVPGFTEVAFIKYDFGSGTAGGTTGFYYVTNPVSGMIEFMGTVAISAPVGSTSAVTFPPEMPDITVSNAFIVSPDGCAQVDAATKATTGFTLIRVAAPAGDGTNTVEFSGQAALAS